MIRILLFSLRMMIWNIIDFIGFMASLPFWIIDFIGFMASLPFWIINKLIISPIIYVSKHNSTKYFMDKSKDFADVLVKYIWPVLIFLTLYFIWINILQLCKANYKNIIKNINLDHIISFILACLTLYALFIQ